MSLSQARIGETQGKRIPGRGSSRVKTLGQKSAWKKLSTGGEECWGAGQAARSEVERGQATQKAASTLWTACGFHIRWDGNAVENSDQKGNLS